MRHRVWPFLILGVAIWKVTAYAREFHFFLIGLGGSPSGTESASTVGQSSCPAVAPNILLQN